ncbi:hypothetical protein NECAME_02993 [Necator americanus]|uniref:Uncharacterized protein n=1 Tax=Necator americanus TaxID=51031 RepID=W2T8T2_NECAM|nr:hypothetical protein NECAME_02993 [Necator americanus]ETN78034.1 hypothetical protein NECAME_02993 [Necator americanus]
MIISDDEKEISSSTYFRQQFCYSSSIGGDKGDFLPGSPGIISELQSYPRGDREYGRSVKLSRPPAPAPCPGEPGNELPD